MYWLVGIVALLGDLGGTRAHDAVHGERVYELASLTWKDAKKLEGKRATFRVVVDSRPGLHGDYVLYDCDSDDDVAKVVWFKVIRRSRIWTSRCWRVGDCDCWCIRGG